MLLLFVVWIKSAVIPYWGAVSLGAISGLMPAVVVCIAGTMALGAVGVRLPGRLGSTIVGGLLSGIGWLLKGLIRHTGRFLEWLVPRIGSLIPRIYRGSRTACLQRGFSKGAANVFAVIMVILFILIII